MKSYGWVKGKNGIPIEIEFEIRNSGELPLEINKIEGSCSCTVIDQEQFILTPGESRKIKAEINTEQLFGEESKTITVFSNAEPKQKTLVVLFEIIENK